MLWYYKKYGGPPKSRNDSKGFEVENVLGWTNRTCRQENSQTSKVLSSNNFRHENDSFVRICALVHPRSAESGNCFAILEVADSI